jgi:hypothetical protein
MRLGSASLLATANDGSAVTKESTLHDNKTTLQQSSSIESRLPEPIGRKAAVRLLRKGAHALLVRPKLHLSSAVQQVPPTDPDLRRSSVGGICRSLPGDPWAPSYAAC